MRSFVRLLAVTGTTLFAIALSAVPRQPIPDKVAPKLPDMAEEFSPANIQLNGWLGDRVLKNESVRLVNVDLEPLLAGYRKKPGSHPWIGEHIGKWMHAATLAWAYTGDDALRRKLDYAATELIKAQETDGYLGTYAPEKRFGLFQGADWDVWSHKYCLLGLLTYHQYTGDAAALEASRHAGDLLIKTFGPAQKSIISAGTHVGMAATSVLEPMVTLYRFTGDERYLDFCRYIVAAWREPNGPKIIDALLQTKQVNQTANGKAYEMLSNLVGLCELARVTGERELLTPVLIAWEDIVARRLYLTGSASQGEHFKDDFALPNTTAANIAETCVTTTWIQLNTQLFRLTGKGRYGDQLERTLYNHLAAAQRPDGAQWCYYTALEGAKPYGPGINCCVSSGPRGMALVPQQAVVLLRGGANQADAIAINLFDPLRATIPVGGQDVTVDVQSEFPRAGRSTLVVRTAQPVRFAFAWRTPLWAQPLALRLEGGGATTTITARDGWTVLSAREWRDGDRVRVSFNLSGDIALGSHGNQGRAAALWGPFVLAYDQKRNPGGPAPGQVAFASPAPDAQTIMLASQADAPLAFSAKIRTVRHSEPHPAMFVPFAEAGADGGRYQVWLWAPGEALPQNSSLSLGAGERRSRRGNLDGSITDGDLETAVVTFDGAKQEEDWFAVAFDEPVTFQRITFAHGRNFHDGGWFDASAGKPRVQMRRIQNGAWETIATLDDYPATTAIDAKGIRDGQTFSVKLSQPQKGVAVRIIGKPACGDNPRQTFSSCGELQIFAE